MTQNKSLITIESFNQKIKECEAEIERLSQRKEEMQKSLEECKEQLESYKKSQEYKLDLIAHSNIAIKPIMGQQEFIIYNALISCEEMRSNFTIYPQVPIKAFINDGEVKKDKNDFEVYNKYKDLVVDFLLVCRDSNYKSLPPFAVLEYHGKGHYNKDNKESVVNNDALKEKLFAKIGLNYYVLNYKEIAQSQNDSMIEIPLLKQYIQKLAKELSVKLNVALKK